MDVIYAERIPVINPARGFGRHIRHHPQSRLYRVPRRGTINSVQHETNIGPLDQGDLGCCTAAAGLKLLSYNPHFQLLQGLFPWTMETVTSYYSKITAVDSFPGQFPPTDTGSDGLASAAAAKELHWISGYLHAFGLDDMLSALQSGPVSVGTNWYSSMSTPRSTGEVRITTNAYLEGGHQYVADGVDVPNKRVWFRQSWGDGWSPLDGGRFWMTWSTVDRLLQESGDVIQFVPINVVAPEPDGPVTPETPVEPTGPTAQDLFDKIKADAAAMGLKV
jgi:hypothetical protein